MKQSRKLLFVTAANKEKYSGGGQCSARNLQSLKDILGESQMVVYVIKPESGRRSIRDKFRRFTDVLHLYGCGMTSRDVVNIKALLSQGDFTDLFIDTSQLGSLSKMAKRVCPDIRIYVFFHNIEYDYMVSTTLRSGDYKHLFWIPIAYHNEKAASRYGDFLISLNRTDHDRLLKLFRRTSTVIPITMHDTFVKTDTVEIPHSGCPEALFVGSYFPGNISGLKWFCDTILPKVNIHLTVVGSGMENLTKVVEPNEKLSILGRVEELAPFYANSDFVLLPIISGGGMKVKTAEALMYGKYIIGTRQALEGYDVDEAVAKECNTIDDFVNTLNNLNIKARYNQQSRELFLRKYSYESSLKKFRECILCSQDQ